MHFIFVVGESAAIVMSSYAIFSILARARGYIKLVYRFGRIVLFGSLDLVAPWQGIFVVDDGCTTAIVISSYAIFSRLARARGYIKLVYTFG